MGNREQVAGICERLRAEVIAHEWHGTGWRTDWAIMLTALDIAQYTGSLVVYLDVRTMAFASGVTAPTASKSLKRLRAGNRLWLDMTHSHEKVTHHVNRTTGEVLAKTHRVYTELPGLAYTYQVNPEPARYVCKFFRSPDGLPGETDPSRATPLIRTLMRTGKTYTSGAARSRLLLGRTEAGVSLGPSRVAVIQVLGDEPQRVKDIAAAARVAPSACGKILAHLESENLSHIAGRGWVRGMPLSEYSARMRGMHGFEPGKGTVARRVSDWQEERREYHASLARGNDEFWIKQEAEWLRDEMSARYGNVLERV